jgi:glutathione synthase/RimK-type ligase-like ATP-grasp enzyme
MVVLIGIPSESPNYYLQESLEKLGINYYMFNQRNIDSLNVSYSFNNGRFVSYIEDSGCRLYQENITGFYYRCMDHRELPEYKKAIEGNKPLAEKTDKFYWKLNRMLEVWESPRIVNKPFFMQSNNSKPYQALVITECGFDIPDTLITGDEEQAKAFINSYNNKVIYKSISGIRSIVKQVKPDDLANLAKIRYCPVQFQEMITGYNVRVHVVGNKTFATKIESEVVDYRYASFENKEAKLSVYKLPDDIAQKCVDLSKKLNLYFSGVDLMFADDGRIICFEVNPSPGYSYYQGSTGQSISDELALFLAKKE